MSDNSAQMSIDFLFGMLIFIGAFAFVLQFATGAIFPFSMSQDDTTVISNKVSEKLVTDEDGGIGTGIHGTVDLGKFESNVENADFEDDFGLPERYRMNISVVPYNFDDEWGEVIVTEGDSVTHAVDPEISLTRRVAHAEVDGEEIEEGDERLVIVKVRVW